MIALMSGVLAFPAGTALAALNWWRMEKTDRAIIHIATNLVGMVLLGWLITQTPGNLRGGQFRD
jgi:uncharacterized membrane protein YbhN (UPF0104 family)